MQNEYKLGALYNALPKPTDQDFAEFKRLNPELGSCTSIFNYFAVTSIIIIFLVKHSFDINTYKIAHLLYVTLNDVFLTSRWS
jgi:hypothetical protein